MAKITIYRTSSISQKLVPGSKFLDGVLYFDQNFKNVEFFGGKTIYIIEKTL